MKKFTVYAHYNVDTEANDFEGCGWSTVDTILEAHKIAYYVYNLFQNGGAYRMDMDVDIQMEYEDANSQHGSVKRVWRNGYFTSFGMEYIKDNHLEDPKNWVDNIRPDGVLKTRA